jgi:NAD-dependent deacetylase
VVEIEARLPETMVVTQNVDDLHEQAGSRVPVHLHGSLFAPRCIGPGAHAVPDTDVPGADDHGDGRRVPPPRCDRCGALVRPGVVWFGEVLPEAALEAAVNAAAACEVLLIVGTSGVVYPAAEIPRIAARDGAAVIQVDPEPTPLDRVCTVNLRGSAAHVLPALVAAAWNAAEHR